MLADVKATGTEPYELLERIGSGAMGEVFRARQVSLKRDVAIKLLGGALRVDEEAIQRFHRETRLLAQLVHPGIVRLLDSGMMQGRLFYAMELVEGGTLGDRIGRDGALRLEEAVPLLVQLAEALAFLHGHGVCHRDVKPGNVMVCGGMLKLVDFGLGRLLGPTSLTATGVTLGTPRYMAPEQFDGALPSTQQDVYGMAALAQELVTGKPCFATGDVDGLLVEKVSGPPPDPRTLVPGLPHWFAQLQLRALARRPEERPSAQQYRDILLAGMPGIADGAARATLRATAGAEARPERGETPHTAQTRISSPRHEPAPPPSGRMRAAYAGALALTAVMLAVTAAVFRPTPGTGQLAVRPSAATTPAPQFAAKGPGFQELRLFETDRSVLVDVDLVDPGGATLEIGKWADGLGLLTILAPAGSCFLHEHVAGLSPDTDHFLRITFKSGRRGLEDYRFRTFTEASARGRLDVAIRFNEADFVGDAAADHLRKFPDPRLVPAVCVALREPGSHAARRLRKLAALASALRSRELADALLPHVLRETDLKTRCGIVRAMALARHPSAGAMAIELLPAALSLAELMDVAEAVALGGGRLACDALAARVTGVRTDTGLARLMARADPQRAREYFRLWMERRAGDPGSTGANALSAPDSTPAVAVHWPVVAVVGFNELGDPRDAVTIAGALRGVTDAALHRVVADALAMIGGPDAARLLSGALRDLLASSAPDPESVGALVSALARIGTAAEAPVLEAVLAGPMRGHRVLAAVALAGTGARSAAPALERALADTDPRVRQAARWALDRLAGSTPAHGDRYVLLPFVRWLRTGRVLEPGSSLDVAAERGPVSPSVLAWQGGEVFHFDRQPRRILAVRRGELLLGAEPRQPEPAPDSSAIVSITR